MALLPVDEALARLLAGVQPTAVEQAPLLAAAGRVLAEPLTARRTQPPFPASAMDGYAVRAADAVAGARLAVIGEAAAGRAHPGAVAAGQAVRIFTGAPVPDGADSILIQEDADASAGGIVVRETVRPGQFVRPSGLDFREGEELLPAGTLLGPRHLSLAAAMNHATLRVRVRPRVAVLSTGDELVEPGSEPGSGQIISSASPAVLAMAQGAGAVAIDLGIARDLLGDLAARLDQAAAGDFDVLVTIGGASVGEHDLVAKALGERGASIDFWKIALRPGKPLFSSRLGAMRVLGLPGNPVSAFVCGIVFLRPLIGALLGRPPVDSTEPAVLGADLPQNHDRDDYLRARLASRPDGLPVATPMPKQDSSMLSVLTAADCLLIRPAHAPAASAGSPCRIIRL